VLAQPGRGAGSQQTCAETLARGVRQACKRIRVHGKAIDRRRTEADDGIRQVVEALLQRAAAGMRLVLGEPVHA
jgi:hypothetical protein